MVLCAGGFFSTLLLLLTPWFAPGSWEVAAAAAAKSLQPCPTLCDSIDGSPPGSPVPWILQARILEWVAILFSNAWKWKLKGKSLSHVRLLVTPWTTAYQAPLSMGFSRQEYWSGVPLPWEVAVRLFWISLEGLVFLYLLVQNLPNSVCMQLILVLYNFFVFCCLRRICPGVSISAKGPETMYKALCPCLWSKMLTQELMIGKCEYAETKNSCWTRVLITI